MSEVKWPKVVTAGSLPPQHHVVSAGQVAKARRLIEAELDKLRTERDDLRRENARYRDALLRIMPLARSVRLLTGADRDVLDMAVSVIRIVDEAFTEAKTETCKYDGYSPGSLYYLQGCAGRVERDVAEWWTYCPDCGKEIDIVSEEVEDE
jgi:hypothetical protein